MAFSFDVKLPRDHTPAWPDRCVCCGAEQPGGTATIWTASIGWWTVVFWSFGGLFSAHVPACRGCGRRLKISRILHFLLTAGVAFLGVAFALWLLASYGGPFKLWLAMGVTLGAMLPYFFLEAVFPHAIDMTCFAKSVDYQFRDRTYAMDFARLNHAFVSEV